MEIWVGKLDVGEGRVRRKGGLNGVIERGRQQIWGKME